MTLFCNYQLTKDGLRYEFDIHSWIWLNTPPNIIVYPDPKYANISYDVITFSLMIIKFVLYIFHWRINLDQINSRQSSNCSWFFDNHCFLEIVSFNQYLTYFLYANWRLHFYFILFNSLRYDIRIHKKVFCV